MDIVLRSLWERTLHQKSFPCLLDSVHSDVVLPWTFQQDVSSWKLEEQDCCHTVTLLDGLTHASRVLLMHISCNTVWPFSLQLLFLLELSTSSSSRSQLILFMYVTACAVIFSNRVSNQPTLSYLDLLLSHCFGCTYSAQAGTRQQAAYSRTSRWVDTWTIKLDEYGCWLWQLCVCSVCMGLSGIHSLCFDFRLYPSWQSVLPLLG